MQFHFLLLNDIMISNKDKFILRYHDININESKK